MSLMVEKHLIPIVGTQFRVAGRAILPMLGADALIVLDPEPDNPYDPDAIKVMVKLDDNEVMTALAYDTIDPSAFDEDGLLHLGYIPRSGAKTDIYGFGNKEVLNVMQGTNEWTAEMTFSPEGKPLVLFSH